MSGLEVSAPEISTDDVITEPELPFVGNELTISNGLAFNNEHKNEILPWMADFLRLFQSEIGTLDVNELKHLITFYQKRVSPKSVSTGFVFSYIGRLPALKIWKGIIKRAIRKNKIDKPTMIMLSSPSDVRRRKHTKDEMLKNSFPRYQHVTNISPRLLQALFDKNISKITLPKSVRETIEHVWDVKNLYFRSNLSLESKESRSWTSESIMEGNYGPSNLGIVENTEGLNTAHLEERRMKSEVGTQKIGEEGYSPFHQLTTDEHINSLQVEVIGPHKTILAAPDGVLVVTEDPIEIETEMELPIIHLVKFEENGVEIEKQTSFEYKRETKPSREHQLAWEDSNNFGVCSHSRDSDYIVTSDESVAYIQPDVSDSEPKPTAQSDVLVDPILDVMSGGCIERSDNSTLTMQVEFDSTVPAIPREDSKIFNLPLKKRKSYKVVDMPLISSYPCTSMLSIADVEVFNHKINNSVGLGYTKDPKYNHMIIQTSSDEVLSASTIEKEDSESLNLPLKKRNAFPVTSSTACGTDNSPTVTSYPPTPMLSIAELEVFRNSINYAQEIALTAEPNFPPTSNVLPSYPIYHNTNELNYNPLIFRTTMKDNLPPENVYPLPAAYNTSFVTTNQGVECTSEQLAKEICSDSREVNTSELFKEEPCGPMRNLQSIEEGFYDHELNYPQLKDDNATQMLSYPCTRMLSIAEIVPYGLTDLAKKGKSTIRKRKSSRKQKHRLEY